MMAGASRQEIRLGLALACAGDGWAGEASCDLILAQRRPAGYYFNDPWDYRFICASERASKGQRGRRSKGFSLFGKYAV